MSFILGLTGSIGMGKSATAAMFRKRGVPVHDADAAVHRLYEGKAAELIDAAFPGAVVNGKVDRKKLSAMVLEDSERLRKLEAIVHPLVRAEEESFLSAHARAALVVLDIPLLFETGAEGRCDAVAVVSAPAALQAERVMGRPGMTAEKFNVILDKQVPDAEKRRRAHFLVDSSRGFDSAEAQVGAIVTCLAGRPGRGASTPREEK